MEPVILEFDHVSGLSKKGFALCDITFSLPAGYIMGLAGKNGAGKTTLIDYIVNPKQRYNGTIRIQGEDIRLNHAAMQNKIGFVSENNNFLLEHSAVSNAKIFGMVYRHFDYDCFYSAMRQMELSESKIIGKMSRGERIRFQMAFAMAHHPAVYLLDEATAGMDPVFRIDFFRILQKVIEEEEASILMTSHIAEEIERKMDFTGILTNGRLSSFQTNDDSACAQNFSENPIFSERKDYEIKSRKK